MCNIVFIPSIYILAHGQHVPVSLNMSMEILWTLNHHIATSTGTKVIVADCHNRRTVPAKVENCIYASVERIGRNAEQQVLGERA